MTLVVNKVEYRKPTPEQLEMLKEIELGYSSHPGGPAIKPDDNADIGVCAMEAVAFITGQPHSDRPVCVSPVIRQFAMEVNDEWGAEERAKLKEVIPELMGTAPVEHITITGRYRSGTPYYSNAQRQGTIHKYPRFKEAERQRRELEAGRAENLNSFAEQLQLLRDMAAIPIVEENDGRDSD